MVDEAALGLIEVEMLLQNLPSLLHLVFGAILCECLADRDAEQFKLAVNQGELVEHLLA